MSEEETLWSSWQQGADMGYLRDSRDTGLEVEVEIDGTRIIRGTVSLVDHDDFAISSMEMVDERIDLIRVTRIRIEESRLIDAEDAIDHSRRGGPEPEGEVRFDEQF